RDPEELVGDLDENISILRAIRHENKLRTGHLRGNKFRLRMGDLEVDGEEALKRAQAIVERIESGGMPNYYGLQRFGRRGETLAMGWGLLRREKAVMGRVRRDRFLKRLALSAAQSDVFNRVLCRRIEEGLWGVVLEGDVLQKVDSGGIFVVGEDEVEESQRRLDEHEVVITGPMPGPKMRLPEGASGEYEAGILEEAGATGELFSGWGKILTGTRRALAVYPEFHGLKVVDEDKEALELEFSLPSGSYATVLMREISKKAFCT
ncbi:MAG: tRNA pseudouridine(13) synthase TruD, partial [Bradymonadaceae bacterium]